MVNQLILSVKRSTWRCHDEKALDADQDYQIARPQVLRRDNFACRYCGFAVLPDRNGEHPTSSKEYSGFLQVHHLNDDHHDNSDENLITACPFCHQVFHAGNAFHRSGGHVIFCPILTQAQINLIANLTAVAQARNGTFAEAADRLWMDLRSLSQVAEERFGEGIADSVNLGAVLMGIHYRRPELYERRGELLAGIRLLPDPEAYSQAIAWWSEHAWLPEVQWEAIFEQYQAGHAGTNYE